MGLTSPPAACLGTRPKCCCRRGQSANEFCCSRGRFWWVELSKERNENYILRFCFFKPWPSHLATHVTVPSSTNCERHTTAPARQSLFCVSAFTELAWTGVGTVWVKRGGQTWPKSNVESHSRTHMHTNEFKARHPTLVRSAMKRLFVLG